MKYLSVTLAPVMILASSVTFAADNYDGQVNITGEVVAQTCKVTNSNNIVNVSLPVVSANLFTAVGKTAATTPFTINLENCTYSDEGEGKTTNRSVGVYFASTGNIDLNSATLNNTSTGSGAAQGVNVALLNGNSNKINLGSDESSQDVIYAPITSGGQISMKFFAQYYSTATSITPGKITAIAPFNIIYQ